VSVEPARPNPDELLARVQAEERQQARGKPRIFLGYAAGVGKTFAMSTWHGGQGVDPPSTLARSVGRGLRTGNPHVAGEHQQPAPQD